MYGGGFKPIRYTRAQVLDCMHNMYMCNGVQIARDVKLDDVPDKLRHPCHIAGSILILDKLQFNIPEMGTSIPYMVCRCCGNFYIPSDLGMYLQGGVGNVYSQWS